MLIPEMQEEFNIKVILVSPKRKIKESSQQMHICAFDIIQQVIWLKNKKIV